MIDIQKIYNDYLEQKQVENREKYKDVKGWFSASSAGSCFRKQLHRTQDLEVGPRDIKSNRLLRLGTLVHADFEKSLDKYKDDKLEVVTEHRIKMPELNVVGHLDVGVIDKETDKIHVYDIKTAGAWKWRMKFGRNPDKNPSINYELQLATYGMGLGTEYDIHDVSLSIQWYNKDNSMMREEPISNLYMDEAFDYWTQLNELKDEIEKPEELIPGKHENVPIYNWECKYCEFQGKYCPGLYSV
tara:strand:+ start:4940 stop:5668 length:729 start_codon:yes stop_codon:yes gene_type:complete